MAGKYPLFAVTLERWYERHKRDLPWRGTDNPYRIWVSEIILQQTRVAQGYDYYRRFIEEFPDVASLAAAPEERVLRAWQGLGYYSRARNMHAAARRVVDVYGGTFPTDYADVRSLKGIGDYTAAAICSIAYGQPFAVLDGNVFRVLSRYFLVDLPIDTGAGKKYFKSLADELLDRARPGLYNQAIMDFGALQCVPKSPACEDCPLADGCLGLSRGRVEELPRKARSLAVTDRYLVYFFVVRGSGVFLHRRGTDDIWAGLYEPYLQEFASRPGTDEILQVVRNVFGPHVQGVRFLREGQKHLLTHRRLWIDSYRIDVDSDFRLPGFEEIQIKGIGKYPMPKPIVELFQRMAGGELIPRP